MKVLGKEEEVEPGKIRPCVVRLPKIKSLTDDTYLDFYNNKEFSQKSFSPETILRHLEELEQTMEKMFKGPLKKRPVNEGSNTTSASNSASRNKMKTPSAKAKVKREVFETPPPTIAASRSRRSIKPNPRYASEDIVTPKMIRTGTATPLLRRSETPVPKALDSAQTTFIENFFNKDTDDDETVDSRNDNKEDRDQPFLIDDSEASEAEVVPVVEAPPKKRRGRPRKNLVNTPSSNSQSDTSKTTVNNITKSQNDSQQLRKNVLPNQVINQTSPNGASLKRKLEENLDTSEQISRKKILLTQGLKVLKSDKVTALENRIGSSPVRKPLTASRSESSKSLEFIPSKAHDSIEELTPQERRRQILAKSLPKGISIKPAPHAGKMSITSKLANHSAAAGQHLSTTKDPASMNSFNLNKSPIEDEENDEEIISDNTNQKQINKSSLQKTVVSRAISSSKRRSASPSSRPNSVTPASPKLSNETNDNLNDDPFGAANSTGEETEMPTFTIVNIHDIIKKKGDPLISHTSPVPQREETPSPTPLNNNNIINNSNNNNEEEEDEERKSLQASPIGREKEKKLPVRLEKPVIGRRKPGPASSKTTPEVKEEQPPVVKRKVGRPRNSERKQLPAKPPTILNHTLNKGRRARSPTIIPVISTNKPAPRILNAVVAKKTEPVKPVIANLEDSADESLQLSLDERDDTEDDSDFELPSKETKTRKITTPNAKENSSAVTNCQNANNIKKLGPTKTPTEKTVIQRDGDKIIKKVTCYETWYVLNIEEDKPTIQPRNQLDIPLVELANQTHDLNLPSEQWTSKVTLYELAPSVDNTNLTKYTGDLSESGIQEEDRDKYQPSCVMFRRSSDPTKRLPYDRAVIFKNKTFFTNIDGKNVRLLGAPNSVTTFEDVEILLQLLNELSLESSFIEQITTTQ